MSDFKEEPLFESSLVDQAYSDSSAACSTEPRPKYDGSECSWVTRTEAQESTTRYLKSNAYEALNQKRNAYIGGNKIKDLLNQEGAVGIRMYLGLYENGDPQLFFVGVDAHDEDLLNSDNHLGKEIILDNNVWCPIFCRGNGDWLYQSIDAQEIIANTYILCSTEPIRYDGSECSWVDRLDAKRSTERYLNSDTLSALKGKRNAYFGGDKLKDLLNQDGAVGIRMYLGQFQDGTPQLFFTGMDSNGIDILNDDNPHQKELIMDTVTWCPPFCGGGNGGW